MLLKRAACVLSACVLLLSGCAKQGKAPEHKPDFEPASASVFMLELHSGDIIYEKAADNRATPYSLVQMLTALLAIEETEDLQAIIPSQTVVADGEAKETGYTMDELLRYAVLESNARATQLISFTAGAGDQNSFISRLNERARGLGAKSTNFADASGEDSSNNYTTARDIAAIAKAVSANDVYMAIARELTYSLNEAEGREADTLDNKNRIEDSTNPDAYVENVSGIKYCEGADGTANLVCVTEQNGMKLLVVLLGCPAGSSVYADARGLVNWALATCKLVKGPESGKPVTELAVADGFAQSSVGLIPVKKLDSLLPKNTAIEETYLLCRLPAQAETALRKGAVVGTADILYEGSFLMTVNLAAEKSVSKEGAAPPWVTTLLVILGVVVGLLVVLMIIRQINIIRYRRIRLRMLDEKRRRMRGELEKEHGAPRPPMKR